MATHQHRLGSTPDVPRARELWLQQAAGFLLFEDVRGYAVDRLDPDMDQEKREVAVKAIDDTLHGLMMVLDGVTGVLRDGSRTVSLRTFVQLNDGDNLEDEVDLIHGDGMCMGYHGWREHDFGKVPVVRSPEDA